ncbi:MAG: hypothetical protein WC854_10840 [Bacteroidales bacterium]
MYPILLIDNEKDYCITLKKIAAMNNFEIHFQTNFEDGFTKLESGIDQFMGVILDARCFRNPDDEVNKLEKDQGIYGAVKKLLEFRKQTGRYIPFCVNTGFSADFRDNLEEMDVQVFDKLTDRDKMFSYLTGEIVKMPETKIRNEFSDVFETFRLGYLDSKTEKKLITILSLLEKEDSTELKELLYNPVRQILEAIYKELNKLDDTLIPGVGINYEKNLVNIYWCMLRLSTGAEYRDSKYTIVVKSIRPVLPDYLGSLLHSITAVVNTKSHDSEVYNYTYLIKGIVYGLLEIILWYKFFIKSKTK